MEKGIGKFRYYLFEVSYLIYFFFSSKYIMGLFYLVNDI